MKKTLAHTYEKKRPKIEQWCRSGMTVKQMALRLDVEPKRMTNILKMLEISLIRLRNEGYTNAK